MTSSIPLSIPHRTFSDDGRWFWAGTAWIPTPPPPRAVDRPGRCSWDGRALDLRLSLSARSVAGLCLATLLLVLCTAAVWWASLGVEGAALLFPVGLAGLTVTSTGAGITRLVFAHQTVHLDTTGVLTRRRWRPAQFVPWEKVRQMGTFYQLRPLVCIDLDTTYWTDRGRAAPHRSPLVAGNWTSFSGSEHMILLESRRLPITEADFLRCVRALAPASVAVHRGLDLRR